MYDRFSPPVSCTSTTALPPGLAGLPLPGARRRLARRHGEAADGIPALDPVLIRPVVVLGGQAVRAEIRRAFSDGERVFVYFQDKLGGEIGLSRTAASPELSFDITIVELIANHVRPPLPDVDDQDFRIAKYGVIELQTTDAHGSYRHAVNGPDQRPRSAR
jgi:hypothetical protein